MWFVVACNPDAGREDDDFFWTVSRVDGHPGWETDGGFPGYGLCYRDAKELADAANSRV